MCIYIYIYIHTHVLSWSLSYHCHYELWTNKLRESLLPVKTLPGGGEGGTKAGTSRISAMVFGDTVSYD